jgi:Uma2 family endonuclease
MTATQLRLWTVEEFHRIIEMGILTADDKVELLEGKIVQMSPQRPPHAGTTQRTSDYLKERLRGIAYVRMQLPVTLSASEPEPDVAVVRIDANDYYDHHPTGEEIFLLIEVAYTTLETDREEKSLIYARANIPEYWVLDICNHRVYVFRNPSDRGYRSETIIDENSAIALLAFPEIEVDFSALFGRSSV